MAGAGLGRDASRPRPAFEPADRRRNANIEQTCRFSPALARLDHTDHPSPKIVRVSLRHRAPATIDAEPESDWRVQRKPRGNYDSHQPGRALETEFSLDFAQYKYLEGRAPNG